MHYALSLLSLVCILFFVNSAFADGLCSLQLPGLLPSDGIDPLWTEDIKVQGVAEHQPAIEEAKARLLARRPTGDVQMAAEEFVAVGLCREAARTASLQHADKGKLKVTFGHIWQGSLENGHWHFKNGWGQRGIQPEWPAP